MSNYRISKVIQLPTSWSGSVNSGENPTVGTRAYDYKNVWGIMVTTGSVGYVSMSGGGALNLAHIAVGNPMPCYPLYVSCSAGTVYILA